MFITKLKIIFQSKYLYLTLLLIALIYVSINICFFKKESVYNQLENSFILKVIDIKDKKDYKIITFSGKEKVISFYYNDFNYQLGDTLEIKGVLTIPSKNNIPNLFNYRNYLSNQNIFYILEIDSISLVSHNNNFLYKMKTFIIERINKLESSAYLHAFILGNTSYINQNIKEEYQSLGISHLFAISGMHVSLLISIISFILKKIKINDYFTFTLIMIFLVIYVFLVNFQVSIIRSVLSYFFLSINKILKLSIKSEHILLLILSFVLILNPFNIYNLGFQYSYLISFILIKYSFLIKGNYLKKLFMVSFLAFIGSLPITLVNNYEINLLAVVFNLVYVPMISIVIFPCSLLVIIFPFLDSIFKFLIYFLENMTSLASDIKLVLIFRKIDLWIVILYLISIFYGLSGMKKHHYSRFLWFISLIIIHYNINLFINEKYVIFFDIGQGDSALINCDDKTILIDTGGSYYTSYSDDLILFMKSIGIRKMDYLILTHGDYDHMGEAINLVNSFKVEKVIFNCGEFNELEKDLIKVLDKKKIPYYSCIKELNIKDNKLYFLNNKDYDNENDNSSVIYTKLNNYKFLFMGDAGVEVEEDLIEKYNIQDIDILKVGHHGSKTSSGKVFIDETNPKYSIISVGKNNRYSHPNKEVLDNLKDSKIYRTDQDGSVMFKIKNNKLEIDTCSP